MNDNPHESSRAIPTHGIGSTGNAAHLNLTRTMADVWGLVEREAVVVDLRPAKMGRPTGPREITKFPYAGKDRFANGEEWGAR